LYLWEHIIEGILEERMNGVWSYGEKSLSSISFRLIDFETFSASQKINSEYRMDPDGTYM
ncbi:ribitol-5-phosphate xylosyltransferase 1, partial [Biomphalaria glabrata]